MRNGDGGHQPAPAGAGGHGAVGADQQLLRRQWQQQAARTLLHLAERNPDLPALMWAVTRDGRLAGWADREFLPLDALAVITWWHRAIGLRDPVRARGAGGEPDRLAAQGQWGGVPVTLAARVLRPGSPGAEKGPGQYAGLPTTRSTTLRGAGALVETLRYSLPVTSWRIPAGGGLIGTIGAAGSEREVIAAIERWSAVIALDGPARAGRGFTGYGMVEGTPVTVRGLAARRAPATGPGGRAPVARPPVRPRPGRASEPQPGIVPGP